VTNSNDTDETVATIDTARALLKSFGSTRSDTMSAVP